MMHKIPERNENNENKFIITPDFKFNLNKIKSQKSVCCLIFPQPANLSKQAHIVFTLILSD